MNKGFESIMQKTDLTFLKPTAVSTDIDALIRKAENLNCASICIPPSWVKYADDLKAPWTKICTVIGFPHGNTSLEAKVAETKQAILDGAREIDMVINIGHALENRLGEIAREISKIRFVCDEMEKDIILKVIVETAYYGDSSTLKKLCVVCAENGADYIKTSTGFASSGAKVSDIEFLKSVIDENHYRLKIKASGGIRTQKDAQAMLNAGAERIGASNIEPDDVDTKIFTQKDISNFINDFCNMCDSQANCADCEFYTAEFDDRLKDRDNSSCLKLYLEKRMS